MRLTVIRYNETQNYHECLDEDSKTRRVDLLVDGSLPKKYVDDPTLLAGKTIECAYLSAFVEIAQEPKID